MGLQNVFRKAALQAVTAFGDVGVSANYLSHASTTYNASSGVHTATFTTVAGVTVIFDEFRIVEIDGLAVRPKDKKAMVPAISISAVTPDAEDRIVTDGSVTWEVVNVRTDPATALWELQVRR